MLKKSKESEWEQRYANLKKEFDGLLEKNQNDLVKIRIREKTLNEKIAAIQLERQQEVRRLKEEIAILEGKLSIQRKQYPKIENKQSEEIISYQISLKAQEIEIKQLTQQNKGLLSNILSLQQQVSGLKILIKEKESQSKYQVMPEQKSAQERAFDKLQKQNEKQKILILRLQQQAKQHQTNYVKLKAEKDEKILSSQSTRKKEADGLKEKIDQLQKGIKKLKSQWEQANNQAEKFEIIKTLKEKQIQQLKQKVEQVKNRPMQILKCLKCADLEQQLQLQKQMLKSVRMMLKFKEMELENLSK